MRLTQLFVAHLSQKVRVAPKISDVIERSSPSCSSPLRRGSVPGNRPPHRTKRAYSFATTRQRPIGPYPIDALFSLQPLAVVVSSVAQKT